MGRYESAHFLVSLASSSALLPREKTRSLQLENWLLQIFEKAKHSIFQTWDLGRSVTSLPGGEYVRQEEGESAVVVQPPNVDVAAGGALDLDIKNNYETNNIFFKKDYSTAPGTR